MLAESEILDLIEPFFPKPDSTQLAKLLAYLDLLLKWNRKINLTSIRSPKEAVTRHFGESLFLARLIWLDGPLLDIGSGAGFPGLALKIAFPELRVTLLEPVAKKRAFLKEVARACEFGGVEVRAERLEDFAAQPAAAAKFEAATCRAVGDLPALIPLAARCLKDRGLACLWLTDTQAAVARSLSDFDWREPARIPLSESRAILIGQKRGEEIKRHRDSG
jgi:16S rRNA (guanine527-N7)-methyltransferase